MIRILDRYLIREIALPFCLGLVLLTFVLEIPPILRDAEALIAKGVEWNVIFRVLLTLLPQALALTIPMAVLLGILIGFGRVSGDREFVAMQACGVSLVRLLRPVTLVAVLATLATAHQIIIALPEANQSYREITFGIVASRVEQNVRPRVFFEDFPDRVIYVRDLPPDGGWRDVFLADTSRPDQTTVYFAHEGRILIDRDKQVVQLQLIDGTSHTTSGARPEEYERQEFERISIILDPTTVFRRPPPKGPPEKTFAELRATIDEAAKQGQPAYSERFMYHYKLALPATCPILALIGLALGASARKDGRLASFVLGFSVILVYYILLYGARAFAMGGQLDPGFAPWIPNIIMGLAAVVMLVWRARSADRPIRFSVPAFWARRTAAPSAAATSATTPAARRRTIVVVRLPQLNLPMPRLLDIYVAREYLRVFLLAVLSLLGIFYISTFIDLADKLFRGSATTRIAARVLLLPDAAVRVLRHPHGCAGRHARHPRRADEEQRDSRDAGLRGQSVPHRIAAARFRAGRERGVVRHAGAGAGAGQPRSGPSQPVDAGIRAPDDGPQPALGGRPIGRDVSLRLLRSARQPVLAPARLPFRPAGVAPASDDLCRGRGAGPRW